MRTVGISHKTRYWQHYCFSNPPQGYRYVRSLDIPWHMARINWEFLANTKFFLPYPRPDLYHTYNGIVGNRHPWVVEVESYLPRFQKVDEKSSLYRWAIRRLGSDDCKAIIFTSNRAMGLNRDRLVANGVDPAKMQVVYRAVESHAPLENEDGRFTILFVGNGFYRKGGLELLKAFERMARPEAHLVIASRLETDWGLCPLPREREWAEKTIAASDRIIHYIDLPHGEVVEQMRAADIFVGATYMDPFNNTVLEAMGTGLPVICSSVGGLAEVVEHGRNSWVIAMDGRSSDDIADELASRMVQLMDDAALRRRMGEESRAIVQEKFTLSVRNAALGKIYDAALRGR